MRKYFFPTVTVLFAAAVVLVLACQKPVRAHCQVPCGIYDDPARVKALLEDATTIDKAVTSINQFSGAHDALAINQATRWIMTKEQHSSHIITTVAEYFLCQRVKEVAAGTPEYQKYLEQLAVHHRVMRAAMKTKQTVDTEDVKALRTAIEELGKLYP